MVEESSTLDPPPWNEQVRKEWTRKCLTSIAMRVMNKPVVQGGFPCVCVVGDLAGKVTRPDITASVQHGMLMFISLFVKPRTHHWKMGGTHPFLIPG